MMDSLRKYTKFFIVFQILVLLSSQVKMIVNVVRWEGWKEIAHFPVTAAVAFFGAIALCLFLRLRGRGGCPDEC